MGNMLINVLAFAVIQGLNGALETLISQSFGASQNKANPESYQKRMRVNCGVFYNRGRFVASCVMIPIIIIFVLSKQILVALHQDEQVSSIAHLYVTLMIPGVWAMGQFDSTKKFLSSQYHTKIPVVVQLITTILHFFWCRHFIINLGMRETGAAIATNITYILNLVVSDFWIRCNQNTDFKDMIFWYDKSCW